MKDLNQLYEQLELHKKSLKDVDETIARLNGTDNANSDGENFPDKSSSARKPTEHSRIVRLNSSSSGGGSNSNNSRRVQMNSDDSFDRKRKSTDDSRNVKRRISSSTTKRRSESGDEDDKKKRRPTVQSSIVARNIKSKEDLIKIQNKYDGSEQRNRRIMGVILGTLKEFKSDDKERSSTAQAINRKELENKIEVKKVEEKRRVLEEKRKLEKERYRKLKTIEITQKKIQLTEDFEFWKSKQVHLKKFIRTKAKPYVFYLPKTLSPNSEKLLAETCQLIEDEIAKKQKEFESEIEILTLDCVNLNNDASADTDSATNHENNISKNDESKTTTTKTSTSDKLEDDIDLNQSLTQPQVVETETTTTTMTPNESTSQQSSTNIAEDPKARKDSSSASTSSSSDSELDEEKNNVQLGDPIDEDIADEDEPIKKLSSQIVTQ